MDERGEREERERGVRGRVVAAVGCLNLLHFCFNVITVLLAWLQQF